MNSAFPAGLPFKMFHRIRDINFPAIDSGFFERLIHDFSSWPYERFAGDIFVIARLFAHQHNSCVLWTFSEYSLRGSFVKMARLAVT